MNGQNLAPDALPNADRLSEIKGVDRGLFDAICKLYAGSGEWYHNDLTIAAHTPLATSDPAGYDFYEQGTQHVVYRGPITIDTGTDGHINELYC